MNKNYLPSKVFLIRIAFVVAVIAIIFGINKAYTYFKNKPSTKKPVTVLVKDVVGKDSNNNGIADWEEYLWGLDPTGNGDSNKDFIISKKKTLSNNNIFDTKIEDTAVEDENDRLAKEFFSVIMSLEQSGTLNDESLNLITENMGQKIAAAPIADIYDKNMLKIVAYSDEVAIDYYNSFNKLADKYSDRNIGDELIFISEGLKNNDATAMEATKTVAEAYKEFGRELMKMSVPTNIADRHLSLANNYEKTGQTVYGLTKVLENPMEGMKSIINYKNYSNGIVFDLGYITDNL